MDPDYIYESMTWAEITAALGYVNQYEEPKVQYKGKKLLIDWIIPKDDKRFRDSMKRLSGELRKNGR